MISKQANALFSVFDYQGRIIYVLFAAGWGFWFVTSAISPEDSLISSAFFAFPLILITPYLAVAVSFVPEKVLEKAPA